MLTPLHMSTPATRSGCASSATSKPPASPPMRAPWSATRTCSSGSTPASTPSPSRSPYEEYHTVGFDANGSIAEQQQATSTGGAVSGAGLANVFQMANNMANRAGKVAAGATPPPLHSE